MYLIQRVIVRTERDTECKHLAQSLAYNIFNSCYFYGSSHYYYFFGFHPNLLLQTSRTLLMPLTYADDSLMCLWTQHTNLRHIRTIRKETVALGVERLYAHSSSTKEAVWLFSINPMGAHKVVILPFQIPTTLLPSHCCSRYSYPKLPATSSTVFLVCKSFWRDVGFCAVMKRVICHHLLCWACDIDTTITYRSCVQIFYRVFNVGKVDINAIG